MEKHNDIVFIIGFVWPEPNSSAAGKRMLQLIQFFKQNDIVIFFGSTALENNYIFDLQDINVKKIIIKLNCDSFDSTLKKINPNIVLFDRFVTEEQFGWRVALNCPNAVRILDTEDLHFLRYTRHENFKNNIPFELSNLLAKDSTKREIASILRCDLTLIIAEYELTLLQDYFKIDSILLFYLPILFQTTEIEIFYGNKTFQERNDFLFIGNFWHEPNWDATVYLKKTIWPLVRKRLPKATIRIYGAYPSQKVFDLNNTKEGFLVLGRAESARQVISDARVLLATLRFGAGIKGKLLEAMQFGTPSVTTAIGAESINATFDWNGFVEDDPETIASKAVDLYTDEELWNQAQINGRIILENRFHIKDFETIFNERIEYLIQNLENHRKSNFIGALLSHHSMKSTEYMSRWIEEKNKNKP